MSKPFTPKLVQVAVSDDATVGVDAEGSVWIYRWQMRKKVDGGFLKQGHYWEPLVATVVNGEMEVEA